MEKSIRIPIKMIAGVLLILAMLAIQFIEPITTTFLGGN